MEGVPLPPGIPGLGGSTDPLEAVLGPFPCVKVGSLPYDASLEDILLLFQGLVVIDVIILGQGEAFVIFANPMDFQMALQRYVQGPRRLDFIQRYSTVYSIEDDETIGSRSDLSNPSLFGHSTVIGRRSVVDLLR
jgi:hypothetical protein